MRGARLLEAALAVVGEHREVAAAVLGAALAVDEAVSLQPVDEPGHAAGAEQHGAREVGHAQAPLRGVLEQQQDLVRAQRKLVGAPRARRPAGGTASSARARSRATPPARRPQSPAAVSLLAHGRLPDGQGSIPVARAPVVLQSRTASRVGGGPAPGASWRRHPLPGPVSRKLTITVSISTVGRRSRCLTRSPRPGSAATTAATSPVSDGWRPTSCASSGTRARSPCATSTKHLRENRRIAYTTVMSVLRNLAAKGLLEQDKSAGGVRVPAQGHRRAGRAEVSSTPWSTRSWAATRGPLIDYLQHPAALTGAERRRAGRPGVSSTASSAATPCWPRAGAAADHRLPSESPSP